MDRSRQSGDVGNAPRSSRLLRMGNENLCGAGYETYGVTVDGPPPLGRIHLGLNTGLTALYGLNGAGKTRLLRAVAAAAGGVAEKGARAALHVRVLAPDAPITDGFLFDALEEIRDSAFAEGAFEEVPPDWFRSSLGSEVFITWRQLCEVTAAPELRATDGLVDAVAASGLLSCFAAGTKNEPAWEVYVDAAPPGGSSSAALDTLNEADRVAAVRASEDSLLRILSAFDVRKTGLLAATNRSDGDRAAWPPGVPVHMWPVGRTTVGALVVHYDDLAPKDLSKQTLDHLLTPQAYGTRPKVLDIADADTVSLDKELLAQAGTVTQVANGVLESVLPSGAPALTFEMRHPEDWIRGRRPEWVARDTPTGARVELAGLSRAERRWAELAIGMTHWRLAKDSWGRPFLILIDEPETGLHRKAEADLPSRLARVCTGLGISAWVATHSPAVLSEPLARLVHVRRDDVQGLARAFEDRRLDSSGAGVAALAERLGLTASDILQLIRVVVVVEGAHDKVVLETLLGNELEEAGAWIVAMRGAKNAPSLADAQLLFDFTDASVLVVLDNVREAEAQRCWTEAREQIRKGNRAAATRALEPLLKLPGWESGWLHELGRRSVETEVLTRLHLFGFSQPDIICYLPASQLVPHATSWSELLGEYQTFKKSHRGDFKEWLRTTQSVNVSRRSIERATRAITEVPDELTSLALRIAELGSFRTPA